MSVELDQRNGSQMDAKLIQPNNENGVTLNEIPSMSTTTSCFVDVQSETINGEDESQQRLNHDNRESDSLDYSNQQLQNEANHDNDQFIDKAENSVFKDVVIVGEIKNEENKPIDHGKPTAWRRTVSTGMKNRVRRFSTMPANLEAPELTEVIVNLKSLDEEIKNEAGSNITDMQIREKVGLTIGHTQQETSNAIIHKEVEPPAFDLLINETAYEEAPASELNSVNFVPGDEYIVVEAEDSNTNVKESSTYCRGLFDIRRSWIARCFLRNKIAIKN